VLGSSHHATFPLLHRENGVVKFCNQTRGVGVGQSSNVYIAIYRYIVITIITKNVCCLA